MNAKNSNMGIMLFNRLKNPTCTMKRSPFPAYKCGNNSFKVKTRAGNVFRILARTHVKTRIHREWMQAPRIISQKLLENTQETGAIIQEKSG